MQLYKPLCWFVGYSSSQQLYKMAAAGKFKESPSYPLSHQDDCSSDACRSRVGPLVRWLITHCIFGRFRAVFASQSGPFASHPSCHLPPQAWIDGKMFKNNTERMSIRKVQIRINGRTHLWYELGLALSSWRNVIYYVDTLFPLIATFSSIYHFYGKDLDLWSLPWSGIAKPREKMIHHTALSFFH